MAGRPVATPQGGVAGRRHGGRVGVGEPPFSVPAACRACPRRPRGSRWRASPGRPTSCASGRTSRTGARRGARWAAPIARPATGSLPTGGRPVGRASGCPRTAGRWCARASGTGRWWVRAGGRRAAGEARPRRRRPEPQPRRLRRQEPDGGPVSTSPVSLPVSVAKPPRKGGLLAPSDPTVACSPVTSRGASVEGSGGASSRPCASSERRPDRHHLPNALTPRSVVMGSIQGRWGRTARRGSSRRLPPREGSASLLRPCPAPGRSRAPPGARDEPALDVARAHPGPVRDASTRRSGARAAATPSGCSARSVPQRLAELAEDAGVRRPRAGARRGPARLPPRAALVPGPRLGGAAVGASATSRWSSGSARSCRTTRAGSASSPATTSRRRATSACRWSRSGCSTARATSASRSRSTAGSRSSTRRSTPRACRCTCSRTRRASRLLVGVAMPGGRTLRARVWLASVGRVPLLLLDADIEENDADLRQITDRLYGGDAEHRIRQEILVGIGGVRAVRAFCGLTGHPAPEVFHTNEGHAGLPRARADPRARRRRRPRLRAGARHRPRRHRLHHPHPGARGHRPLPGRPRRALLHRRHAAGHRAVAGARAGPRAGAATCSTWRTWACASRSARTVSRSCTARSRAGCSSPCGAGSTPPRCRSAR